MTHSSLTGWPYKVTAQQHPHSVEGFMVVRFYKGKLEERQYCKTQDGAASVIDSMKETMKIWFKLGLIDNVDEMVYKLVEIKYEPKEPYKYVWQLKEQVVN